MIIQYSIQQVIWFIVLYIGNFRLHTTCKAHIIANITVSQRIKLTSKQQIYDNKVKYQCQDSPSFNVSFLWFQRFPPRILFIHIFIDNCLCTMTRLLAILAMNILDMDKSCIFKWMLAAADDKTNSCLWSNVFSRVMNEGDFGIPCWINLVCDVLVANWGSHSMLACMWSNPGILNSNHGYKSCISYPSWSSRLQRSCWKLYLWSYEVGSTKDVFIFDSTWANDKGVVDNHQLNGPGPDNSVACQKLF